MVNGTRVRHYYIVTFKFSMWFTSASWQTRNKKRDRPGCRRNKSGLIFISSSIPLSFGDQANPITTGTWAGEIWWLYRQWENYTLHRWRYFSTRVPCDPITYRVTSVSHWNSNVHIGPTLEQMIIFYRFTHLIHYEF